MPTSPPYSALTIRSESKLSLSFIPAPNQRTCGGLLCDEMGLGKTLQVRNLWKFEVVCNQTSKEALDHLRI